MIRSCLEQTNSYFQNNTAVPFLNSTDIVDLINQNNLKKSEISYSFHISLDKDTKKSCMDTKLGFVQPL